VKPFVFLFIILLNVFAVNAQPSHYANTHPVGKDNPLVDFNQMNSTKLPNGEILYLSYNGKAAIIGNNYVDSIKGWPARGLSSIYPIVIDDEVWLMGINGMAIVKNKSVIKLLKTDWSNSWFVKSKFKKGVYLGDYGKARVGFFDGQKIIYEVNTDTSNSIVSQQLIINVMPDSENNLWYFSMMGHQLLIHKYNTTLHRFDSVAMHNIPDYVKDFNVISIKDENNFILQSLNRKNLILCKNRSITTQNRIVNMPGIHEPILFSNHLTNGQVVASYPSNNYSQLFGAGYLLNHSNEKPLITIEGSLKSYTIFDSSSNSYFMGTENKPLWGFPYLQNYPRLYNNNHSNATFSLSQDSDGNIWAGSYNGYISIIDKGKDKISSLPSSFQVMNGSLQLKDKTYLIGEGIIGLAQILGNKIKEIENDVNTGFFLYQSPTNQKIYYGKGAFLGLWQTDAASLDKTNPNWHKIDSTRGLNLHNILTITEDKKGRIWCGHPGRGIAVYNPATDKANTYLIDKNQSPFGAMCSLTDKWGTVWLGSRAKGLWYYNDYSKEASPANCKLINHPLLSDPSKTITGMTAWYGKENYLVLACYDKLCVLNLDSFYNSKKIVVRYLNPQAASFTSFTEQNTLFTSHADSSIWFSTSDMVYNWDFKKWLTLTPHKVNVALRLVMKNDSVLSLQPDKKLVLEPTGNNLSFEVRLLSPDLQPRYLNLALVKDGDSLQLDAPGLLSVYHFKNLSSGKYSLYVRIFENDGSISTYKYRIVISKFLWQQWWFWALLSALVVSVLVYLLNIKRKKQVAEQKAKTQEAELDSYKAEQEKKMANLRLLTLSSQFRPHFILNALNTIGARMDKNPETESVLSRLGESVNLIFNHATQQKTLHSFQSEWLLVVNIIHIHRLMYLKELAMQLPDDATIAQYADLQVPMGLLQIPVENALLHGLGNKETAPWQLSIDIQQKELGIHISITDNGIGRKKAVNLSNFTKHGTGTRNQNEIIAIINAVNPHKISVQYEDEIFDNRTEKFGTRVHLFIPYNLKYEN